MNFHFRTKFKRISTLAIASVVMLGTGNLSAAPAKNLAKNPGKKVGFCEDFQRLGPTKKGGWTGKQPGAISINSGARGAKSIKHRANGTLANRKNGKHGPARDSVLKSPVFKTQYGTLSVDVQISGKGGEYIIGTRDINADMQNIMLRFNPDGTIDAFEVVQYLGLWRPTTGSWIPGFITSIELRILPDHSVTVFQDGGKIYSGRNNAFSIGRPSNGISQFFVRDSNGSSDPGTSISIDNIRLNC